LAENIVTRPVQRSRARQGQGNNWVSYKNEVMGQT